MKRSIAICLAILVCAGLAWAGGGTTVMLAGGVPVSAASYPDILFHWGMEGATWSNAEKAAGSATGSVESDAADSTAQHAVGAHSLFSTSGYDRVTFIPTSNINYNVGTIGAYFRVAAWNDLSSLFYSAYNDNNRIFVLLADSNELRWRYYAGSSGTDRTTSGCDLATNTWYFYQFHYNNTTDQYSITVYNAAGSQICTDSSTDTAGTWAGTPSTFDIGDNINSGDADIYFDQVIISNSSTRDLNAIKDLSSYPD